MAGIEASVLTTFGVGDAVSAAAVIAERLPDNLSSTAVRLYTALCAAAIETMRGRGYSAHTTHMVMHCPVEQVAKACGISRVSAWRYLPALRALGVLDWRTHKANLRGKSRNSGTVWQVRLNPSAGTRARLSYQDLKHRWRDLDRDCKRGRTSYRALTASSRQGLKHTKANPTNQIQLSVITDWTLPVTGQKPVKVCMFQPSKPVSLESLFDVRFAGKPERSKAVDTAATALAQALSDSRSVDFYRRIVWGAYRANQRGLDYFQVLFNLATRAKVDLQESFARRAGALFVSRLKAAGLLDELMQT